jgi:hypothetical protein
VPLLRGDSSSSSRPIMRSSAVLIGLITPAAEAGLLPDLEEREGPRLRGALAPLWPCSGPAAIDIFSRFASRRAWLSETSASAEPPRRAPLRGPAAAGLGRAVVSLLSRDSTADSLSSATAVFFLTWYSFIWDSRCFEVPSHVPEFFLLNLSMARLSAALVAIVCPQANERRSAATPDKLNAQGTHRNAIQTSLNSLPSAVQEGITG